MKTSILADSIKYAPLELQSNVISLLAQATPIWFSAAGMSLEQIDELALKLNLATGVCLWLDLIGLYFSSNLDHNSDLFKSVRAAFPEINE